MDLADLSWPAISELPRNQPVVIPVAAVEQHGHHLPVYTDSLLLGEICRRIKPRLTVDALFLPLQWLGNSHHHLDFAGTLSAPPRTYLDLLLSLAENLLHHGFCRLVFLNGHGGNDIPGKQAVFELRQKYRDRDDLLLLFATYWNLSKDRQPSDAHPNLVQREMGHACEWETSMILRLSPNLVGDYAAAPPVEFGNQFAEAGRGWITKERTFTGHIGYPHLASAEKGEALFEFFANSAASFITRVAKWDGRSW